MHLNFWTPYIYVVPQKLCLKKRCAFLSANDPAPHKVMYIFVAKTRCFETRRVFVMLKIQCLRMLSAFAALGNTMLQNYVYICCVQSTMLQECVCICCIQKTMLQDCVCICCVKDTRTRWHTWQHRKRCGQMWWKHSSIWLVPGCLFASCTSAGGFR